MLGVARPTWVRHVITFFTHPRGWKGRWLWRVLLAISRMLCSVTVAGFLLSTVSDLRRREKTRHGKKGPDNHRFPQCRLARRERHRRSTCRCRLEPPVQRNASAVGPHHSSFARSRVPVYMWYHNVLRLAGPEGAGKRGTGAATTIPSLRSYSDCTCGQPMGRDDLACLAWLALGPSR